MFNVLELHYSTGGHGGPYSFAEAIPRAIARLRGLRNERRITIREGVGGPIVAIVTRYADNSLNVGFPDGTYLREIK